MRKGGAVVGEAQARAGARFGLEVHSIARVFQEEKFQKGRECGWHSAEGQRCLVAWILWEGKKGFGFTSSRD